MASFNKQFCAPFPSICPSIFFTHFGQQSASIQLVQSAAGGRGEPAMLNPYSSPALRCFQILPKQEISINPSFEVPLPHKVTDAVELPDLVWLNRSFSSLCNDQLFPARLLTIDFPSPSLLSIISQPFTFTNRLFPGRTITALIRAPAAG
ncbi:hypothetical protein AVEN_112094-1 [Araneus ventricosus]|uniref:Uncharacterized protein n=1 Tax=Araneus ventricosus TaxID=182803 RepID=A0A4Y2MB35_ARAVE|nr:hypothetical protein AVEN_112094-1 [Araneus ventricosus]